MITLSIIHRHTSLSIVSPITNERSSIPHANQSAIPLRNNEQMQAFYHAIIARWMARKHNMGTSILGDNKPCSGIGKCLEIKARALSKISPSIQFLFFEGFESTMNKVHKLNKF